MTFSVYFTYLSGEISQPRLVSSYANCTQSYALWTIEYVFMTHQCNLSRMCTDSSRALLVISCYTPQTIHQESEKHGEKHCFGANTSLWKMDLIPRWAASWSNCKQNRALSTNNGFHGLLVQSRECALLCLGHCRVVFSVSQAALYFRVNAHQECKTRQIERFQGYLKLCILDLKPRGPGKWSNCAQIHAICTKEKVFLTQKIDLSRICTTQSRVV